VSAGEDKVLRVWDAEAACCLATLPLPASALSVACHPGQAIIACGDAGGSFHLMDLVGSVMGSLVVSAVDGGDGPEVCCPVCRERYPSDDSWLGREVRCPAQCGTRLRVNLFVVRRVPASNSWLSRWWRR
jgi:hypothetical protein